MYFFVINIFFYYTYQYNKAIFSKDIKNTAGGFMSLFKSVATFGGLTLVSRLTGFLRDMVLANYLGAGAVSDAFVVAFKLPNLFRSLFAEGAFTSAFVPLFSQKLVSEGRKRSIFFAAQAMSVLALFVGIFVFIFEICMPFIVEILAPGFRSEPEKIILATQLCRITFPFLLLISLVSFQGGYLLSLAAAACCFKLVEGEVAGIAVGLAGNCAVLISAELVSCAGVTGQLYSIIALTGKGKRTVSKGNGPTVISSFDTVIITARRRNIFTVAVSQLDSGSIHSDGPQQAGINGNSIIFCGHTGRSDPATVQNRWCVTVVGNQHILATHQLVGGSDFGCRCFRLRRKYRHRQQREQHQA